MSTIDDAYWKWFSHDDNNGTRDAYHAGANLGFELAKKQLEEQLIEAKDIIEMLFEWDNLTSNEVYKLQERFKTLKNK